MAAQYDLHLAGIDLTADALQAAFGPGLLDPTARDARPQPPRRSRPGCGRDHRGAERGQRARSPRAALLVVEVSDSSLNFDRNRKGSLYAAAGVADYWIVNLVQRQLEVHRVPTADAAQPFGFGYSSRTILDPGDAIAPLAAPKARVAVADLLP